MEIWYLSEDGHSENGVETTDIVNEKEYPYAIKQLVDVHTHLEIYPDLHVIESKINENSPDTSNKIRTLYHNT